MFLKDRVHVLNLITFRFVNVNSQQITINAF